MNEAHQFYEQRSLPTSLFSTSTSAERVVSRLTLTVALSLSPVIYDESREPSCHPFPTAAVAHTHCSASDQPFRHCSSKAPASTALFKDDYDIHGQDGEARSGPFSLRGWQTEEARAEGEEEGALDALLA